jgi:hypothetical protein
MPKYVCDKCKNYETDLCDECFRLSCLTDHYQPNRLRKQELKSSEKELL